MTIVDVAKAAGVSPSTVSRVINGSTQISAATTARVQKAMKQVGYIPSLPQHRRGPRLKPTRGIRSGNIAVLTFGVAPRLEATHFALNLQGISNALCEHGLNMIYCHVTDPNSIPPCILGNNEVDGFIFVHGEPTPQIIKKIGRLPAVFLSSHHTQQGDHIISGNHEVGHIAANYLIQRGHTRLAFLNGIPAYAANRARGEGFLFSAFKHGVTDVAMLVGPTDKPESVRAKDLQELDGRVSGLVEQLLELSPRPTGMFVPQDKMTAVVYRELSAQGVKAGCDITIVSADNEAPYLAGLYPRPATIDIGIDEQGRKAIDLLLWRMGNQDSTSSPLHVTLKPSLIEQDNASVQSHGGL
jgi:DNA-binding LacI/PurR family transcriptional regulator